MRKILLVAIFAVMSMLPGVCASVYESPGSVPASAIYTSTVAVPGTDTVISFGRACRKVTITLSSGSSLLYINPSGTADNTKFILPSGASLAYKAEEGDPLLDSVHVCGSGTSGTVSVWAQ